jgi:3-dehydroquinate synthase
MAGARQKRRARAGDPLRVELGERSYPIHIGSDDLVQAGAEIARLTQASHVAIVTVPEVGRRYAAALSKGLRSEGIKVHRFDVPDGDRSKNLREVAKLYSAFLEKGLDRSSAAIALGGGVVGDLTGYVAATYLRGISFVQVPTTLLSMVDASVGGKVGVNLPEGKNLVGAFYQPKLVWIDAGTLRTLPERQRVAGMGEVIKHAAIWDEKLFADLESAAEAVLALDPEWIEPVIRRNCAIKAEVVAQDERESGLRMLLNFGHTLGHAVETIGRYRKVLHGEAVGMGMVYAAQRSEELGLAPSGTHERLEALVSRVGLPTLLPGFPRKAYLSALRVDKKRTGARIRFVALRAIGRAEIVPLTPAEIFPPRRAPVARTKRV